MFDSPRAKLSTSRVIPFIRSICRNTSPAIRSRSFWPSSRARTFPLPADIDGPGHLPREHGEDLEIPVAEPAGFLLVEHLDRADRLVVEHHRHADDGAYGEVQGVREVGQVPGVGLRIVGDDRLAVLGDPADDPAAFGQGHLAYGGGSVADGAAKEEAVSGVVQEHQRGGLTVEDLDRTSEDVGDHLVHVHGPADLLLDVVEQVQLKGALGELVVGLLELHVLGDQAAVEEGVLEADGGLGGEGLEKLDIVVVKGLTAALVERLEHSDAAAAVVFQGDGYDRAGLVARRPIHVLEEPPVVVGVPDVDRFGVLSDPAHEALPHGQADLVGTLGDLAPNLVGVAIDQEEGGPVGVHDPGDRGDDEVEELVSIEGRGEGLPDLPDRREPGIGSGQAGHHRILDLERATPGTPQTRPLFTLISSAFVLHLAPPLRVSTRPPIPCRIGVNLSRCQASPGSPKCPHMSVIWSSSWTNQSPS